MTAALRRVEAERGVELVERFLVHAVDAEGLAGDEVDVPVVGGGLEEVLDAVAGGLFFAAGEEHVDAVEVGFGGAGVEREGLVEGAAGFEDVHLAAEAVAGVLEVGDAEAGPAGGEVLILAGRRRSKRSRARSRSSRLPVRDMKEERTARAWRYSSERSSVSEVWRAVPRLSLTEWRSPKPCRVLKTSLQISVWTLMRSKEATLMEPPARTLWLGTSSSCQLRSKPFSERRKLPARTNWTSSLRPMARGSSCWAGMRHEGAGRADDEGGHAGEAGGDGVGEGVAVERERRWAGPKLMKGRTTMVF